MNASNRFTCRRSGSAKRWAIATIAAMLLSTNADPVLMPVAAQTAPVGAGFTLDARDLRFIFHQIEIAQAHAAGGQLFGSGANQVPEVRLPFGLRTVDGSFNHLTPNQQTFGAADQIFPRLTRPVFRPAEDFDPDGAGPAPATPTSYEQTKGVVADSRPRVISNLIVDQTERNPAALEVAGPGARRDSLGTLFIPNVAPDVGLSAPFNVMFTFFGQFFDHGLDLVTKGGGVVFVPLKADDPLIAGPDGISGNADDLPPDRRFMVLTRATNQPGPDGIVGDDPTTPRDESADDVHEATNTTTPFVDQNQTYTSHPSHQVFLREYASNADGKPVATGRLIDGGGTIGGVPVKNIGNWGEVKAQAETMLGIGLVDSDVFNVPLLATDPYGRFLRGPNGFPMLMMRNGTAVEGHPNAPISTADALKTGHAFLDDIAHNAVPREGLSPDPDSAIGTANDVQPPGTYDDELLDRHFVTGDGRGNENIALTAVHTIFHAEHNRLAEDIDRLIPLLLTDLEVAAWRAVHPASGWDYGERLFQAARFVTEMQYQHLVFEEFARKLVPSINAFIPDGINFQSDTNPAITAEFAHQVYRLGHSMLTETISRTNANGSPNDIPLLDGFLNPVAFNDGGGAGRLTAAQAAGAIFQGGTRQVANEIDEFVTEAVRNRLLGLPLDLAVLNLSRGRSEGIPPLNVVRRQLFEASGDSSLTPYLDWFDFSFAIKYPESLVNFVAAYGKHPTLADAETLADKRDRAAALVTDPEFMFAPAAESGVNDIDLWIGGLAERISPFGSMLGSTFTYVFEHQLENLQNADRFYYLERLDGLNLLVQLEANSFAELISRNTTLDSPAADVFSRADFLFNVANLGATGAVPDDPTTPQNESAVLSRMADGTIRFAGPEHVIWNGSDSRGDRIWSSEGDDTLRGNGGNDIMEGGAGNDNHLGGEGDDILTDTFGDDVMKGGPGNDAISGGPGLDLLQGNAGKDFIIAGNDNSEIFGGQGDDVIYTGDGATESFGGAGDDWLEGGNQLNLLVGDENNQFQDDPNQGHDVIIGGRGDDDFDSEGGDDIMVAGVLGTDRLEGMLGFDWVTYRGDPLPVDADMSIRVVLPPNLDELRDRYDLAEALSGYNQNDILRGEARTAAEMAGHELTAAGIARIDGLNAFLNGATSFTGGNIIMGGAGSDIIEGRGGDDFIDGDAWLNVQLRAPNPATPDPADVQFVDTLHALKTDVFAGRINPGQIAIVRSILTPTVPPADCAAGAAALNCDTAVFSGNQAEYTITPRADGTVTVDHNGGIDGIDTLRNIEQLRFADGVVPTPTATTTVQVPVVVGLSAQAAANALLAAGLTAVTTTANSTTMPIDSVIAQAPRAGQVAQLGSAVTLTISLGAQVPSVVGQTQSAAITALSSAGLLASVSTVNDSAPSGQVISQNPAAASNVQPGSVVALRVSLGPEVSITLDTGLVTSFGFNEASGAAIDGAVGKVTGDVANNGTLNAGVTRVPGRAGNAVAFNGTSGMITVPDAAALRVQKMTLSAWVKSSSPSTESSWRDVILKETMGDLAYGLYANADTDGGPTAYIRRAPTSSTITQHAGSATRIPANTWVHLATTYDGTALRMYVNGVQVGSLNATGNIVSSTAPLTIGGNRVWGEFFKGAVDDVRIYNRALSPSEIQSLMNTIVP